MLPNVIIEDVADGIRMIGSLRSTLLDDVPLDTGPLETLPDFERDDDFREWTSFSSASLIK